MAPNISVVTDSARLGAPFLHVWPGIWSKGLPPLALLLHGGSEVAFRGALGLVFELVDAAKVVWPMNPLLVDLVVVSVATSVVAESASAVVVVEEPREIDPMTIVLVV
jgi:hypothetical protein